MPTLTYQVSNLVNGDTLTGGLATSATSTSSVGTYAITQGNLAASANYALTYNGASNTITPRSITVSADAKTQTYGDAVPTLTYQVSNLVNGDTLSGNLATAATNTSSVGTYAITQGNLAASANYALTYNGANNTITPRSVILFGQQVYDGTNIAQGANLAATNLVNGDTLSIGGSATFSQKNIGLQTLTSLANLTFSNSNYTLMGSSGTISVTPKPLSVTYEANATESSYGGALSTLSGTISATGLVSGDSLADLGVASWTTNAHASGNVGTYSITGSGLSASNYTITSQQAAGNATAYRITPKALVVSANQQSMKRGEAEPALTYTYSGLVNGDTRADFQGALVRAMGDSVGSYAISRGSLTAIGNYTIGTFNPGVFNILAQNLPQNLAQDRPIAKLPSFVLVEAQAIASIASIRPTSWMTSMPVITRVGSLSQTRKTTSSDDVIFDQPSNLRRMTDQPATGVEAGTSAWLQIDTSLANALELN